MNDGGDGIGWGVVDSYEGVGGYYVIVCFFFICVFVFWSLVSSLF